MTSPFCPQSHLLLHSPVWLSGPWRLFVSHRGLAGNVGFLLPHALSLNRIQSPGTSPTTGFSLTLALNQGLTSRPDSSYSSANSLFVKKLRVTPPTWQLCYSLPRWPSKPPHQHLEASLRFSFCLPYPALRSPHAM